MLSSRHVGATPSLATLASPPHEGENNSCLGGVMQWTYLSLLSALVVFVCFLPIEAQSHQVSVVKNVDYIPNLDYPDGKDRLDLYIPKGVTNAPVILSIHGGALSEGDRAEE